MTTSDKSQEPEPLYDLHLRKLTVQQVRQIDQFLVTLEEYGEIRLIVECGILKYINRVESHKVGSNEPEDEN